MVGGAKTNGGHPSSGVTDFISAGSGERGGIEPTIRRGVVQFSRLQVRHVRALNLEAIVAKGIGCREAEREAAAEAHD